jgi:hypothetical protein
VVEYVAGQARTHRLNTDQEFVQAVGDGLLRGASTQNPK